MSYFMRIRISRLPSCAARVLPAPDFSEALIRNAGTTDSIRGTPVGETRSSCGDAE